MYLQTRGRPGARGRGSTGGKVQLYSVEQLVSTVAGIMTALCEHLENASGFFQVSLQPARLAQSVEHGTLNPRVVGSSPTSGDFFLNFFLR